MSKIVSVAKETISTKRPGIHSKSKTSNHKSSKCYRKKYRGQGK